MAISVTSDLSDITTSDTTTTSGTFYRLGGAASANPATDADAYVQGAGCVAWKCSNTVSPTDTGGHFNSTATFDVTSKHVFSWRLAVTAGNMVAKASEGIVLGLTNTSTTSTSAWSTTSMKKWFLDGSDTQPNSTGWVCYVVDPSTAGDASAGTLTLTTVKNVGLMVRQTSTVTSTLNNVFADAVRMGTGLTATASSGADVITFASLYATDSNKTNSWGIITAVAGIYYGAGKMTIGSASQANICAFTDSSQVLIFRTYPVAVTLYEFLLKGASGQKTTVSLTSCVIRGQTTAAVWNITCNDAFSDFKAYSCAFANIRQATLSAGSILSGCTLAASGTITTAGAAITNCAFSPTTATTQVSAAAGAQATAVSGCTFTSAGTGHGMEITGTAADTTLTNDTWTGYSGTSTNAAVFVNIATGAMTLTITGGTVPSIRTAGCTVTVSTGSRTVTVKSQTALGAVIGTAMVNLETATGGGAGSLPYNVTVTIVNSGTLATVTHATHLLVTSDKVVIRGASHNANNGVFSITKIDAGSYSYTMLSTPGSSPTGTIKSTFVLLYGTTDAGTGEISMSREFPVAQPVTGWARKMSASPFYKEGPINTTVSSTANTYISSTLVSDE